MPCFVKNILITCIFLHFSAFVLLAQEQKNTHENTLSVPADTELPQKNILNQKDNPFPENYFTPYTVADGLPSNKIMAITVDKFGFVWVGTENGLARYDGQRFQQFSSLLPAASNLPKNPIVYLFADKSGNLWVRYVISGIFKIDLTTLKVEKIYYPEIKWRLCSFETQAGEIWHLSNEGLLQWEKKTQSFHKYPQPEVDSSRMQNMCKGHADFAWIATLNGFYRFDLTQKKYEKEPELDGFAGKIFSMTVDNKGHLWFSRWYTEKDGIVEYDPFQKRVVQTFSKQTNSKEGFINTDVWNIRADDNKLWFSMNAGGLYVYDTDRRLLHHYANDTNQKNSLSSGELYTTIRDSLGNIWVGNSNMLHQIPYKRKTTEKLPHIPGNNNSLINPIATTVITVDKENMWIGTRIGCCEQKFIRH